MRFKKPLLSMTLLLGLGLVGCNSTPTESKSKEPEEPKKVSVIVLSGQSNMEGSTLWGETGVSSHEDDDPWLANCFEERGWDDVNDYIDGTIEEVQVSFRCFYPYESPYKLNASNMENDGMDGEFKNLQVGMANQTRFIGPEIGMTKVIREHGESDAPIFLIKSAYGGSSLGDQWGTNKEYIWRTKSDGNGTEGKLWTETKTFVDNNLELIKDMGYEPVVKAWCWHQGESDGSNDNYGKYMNNLISEFREYFEEYAPEQNGENIAFVDCTIYDGDRISYNADRKGGLNDMKKEIEAQNDMNFLINGSMKEEGGLKLQIGGNSDLDGGFNKYHYITKDCLRLGEAYGNILVDNGII